MSAVPLNGGHSALQEFRPLSPDSGNSPPADGVFKKPVEVGTTMMYGQCSVIVENFARGDPMKFISADPSTILDRILDTAADNLRIAKILVLLGLDPNNVTYDAIFNRLFEIMLAQITLASMCALMGSIFFVATLLMRTMVPLRISNMISNVFFMAFGALAGDIRTFLMYLLMLPINGVRLYQMHNLVKMARNATKGDKSMEWLKPFMTERKYRKGDKLFSKGDAANEMFLTITGKFLVTEFSKELRREV